MTTSETPAGRPRRILTVCLGNHCRSPLAEAVLARRGGDRVDVRSAGLRDKHVGRPAHPAMVAAAARAGYDLSAHRGIRISPELAAWADVILAMDRSNQAALRGIVDTRVAVLLYLGDQEVPDPWGRPDEDFDACVALIEAGAARHLP